MTEPLNTYRGGPDERGHFGLFGGRYVAETLMPLILDLERAYNAAKEDPSFQAELDSLNAHYSGRPSPLYFAERLTEHLGGAKVYFKRDELNHTGSHKINNCLGQIQLARRMGKTRIIAETGAGQHGVAVATVSARFGLPCEIYMGATDIERQKPNVFRMRLLGAKVNPVTSGSGTLKDAMNDALRDWVANVHDTFYIIGTVAGPHPYSAMVRDFQSVIGKEVREQMMEREGRLSGHAGGVYRRWIQRYGPLPSVPRRPILGDLRRGSRRTRHRRSERPCGVHDGRTAGRAAWQSHHLLQNDDGQILEGHSISAGLDYPGVGPEHAWLGTPAVTYVAVTDQGSARRLPALLQARRHHPGARAVARAGLCPQARARTSEGQFVGHEHVRPRRQGHLRRRRAPLDGNVAMTRIDQTFARLKAEGRGGLVTFITAGDPDYETSLSLLKGLPAAGADIIELGMPFSDPMADGPAIQASSLRALKAGQTMKKTLSMVREFRKEDQVTPIVLMGYYNPIYVYAVDRSSRTRARPVPTV